MAQLTNKRGQPSSILLCGWILLLLLELSCFEVCSAVSLVSNNSTLDASISRNEWFSRIIGQRSNNYLRSKSTSSQYAISDFSKGIEFQRQISSSHPTATAVVDISPKDDCQKYDDFGANDCQFTWGTLVHVDYHVQFSEPIQEDDYVEGHLKLDNYLPYHFECALCGADCKLEVPVIHASFTIPMEPHCPVPAGNRSKHLDFQLWQHSPSHGLVETTVDGTILVVQGRTGHTIVEIQIQVEVK